MKYSTPESMGISSERIKEYIKLLEDKNLSTHDIIIYRKGNIIFENYRKPFHKDFLHRMYSVSKSFVSIAIGFLEQDGLIKLDESICKYFPEETKNVTDENVRNQTIRNMLMMSTAKTPESWFTAKPADRVAYYFANKSKNSRPSGTIFQYDSSGSFVLGALVERITGKYFMDYLREKLFDKIDVSKEAHCLKCPGGHSWGDSAILCTAQDLLKVARFVMNKGKVNGEQILNEQYITDATSCQITNDPNGINIFKTQGYGYQFWIGYHNSFWFNGMGCQYALCMPDKEMIMIYNGDNQGKEFAASTIIDNFFRLIYDTASDNPIADENSDLLSYASTLSLMAAKGAKTSECQKLINGKTYKLNDNPMGITKIRFEFSENKGTFYYTNEQGDKELPFGMCENEFSKFPQNGYADEYGTVASDILYDCATSAAWVEDNKLVLKMQIIDKYFGNSDMTFSFTNDNKVAIYMISAAEDFLSEYQGFAMGKTI